MKHLRKFDSVSEMNTVIANSTIGILGLAYNNGTPVMKNKPGSSPVPPTPSHDYVEIGGIKWATMNIGASTIYDTGLYFQWGDTQGYNAEQVSGGQKYFGWSDCVFNPSGDEQTFTKYNQTDGKTILDLEDDAVHAAWGGNWRMPTNIEVQTLINSINYTWVTNYNNSGMNGMVCTDKNDSTKVLFFPANDEGEDDVIYDDKSYGTIWCSVIYPNMVDSSYFISLYDDVFVLSSGGRCCGYGCRGVLDD